MRARNVKPGFFKNEELADCGPYAMLLFEGLWLLADRAGRVEARYRRIHGELFAYFPRTNVERLTSLLEQKGFIKQYSVNGSKYIQIVNFEKHQNPHVNEAQSTIQAPESNGSSTIPLALNPSSLIPSSLIPESRKNATHSVRSPKNGSHNKAPLSPEQVIEELQQQPAFKALNVHREYDKCLAWCSANGKDAPSKKRLVNWCLRSVGDAPLLKPNKSGSSEVMKFLEERGIN